MQQLLSGNSARTGAPNLCHETCVYVPVCLVVRLSVSVSVLFVVIVSGVLFFPFFFHGCLPTCLSLFVSSPHSIWSFVRLSSGYLPVYQYLFIYSNYVGIHPSTYLPISTIRSLYYCACAHVTTKTTIQRMLLWRYPMAPSVQMTPTLEPNVCR